MTVVITGVYKCGVVWCLGILSFLCVVLVVTRVKIKLKKKPFQVLV